jgi:hypothetical protein
VRNRNRQRAIADQRGPARAFGFGHRRSFAVGRVEIGNCRSLPWGPGETRRISGMGGSWPWGDRPSLACSLAATRELAGNDLPRLWVPRAACPPVRGLHGRTSRPWHPMPRWNVPQYRRKSFTSLAMDKESSCGAVDASEWLAWEKADKTGRRREDEDAHPTSSDGDDPCLNKRLPLLPPPWLRAEWHFLGFISFATAVAVQVYVVH